MPEFWQRNPDLWWLPSYFCKDDSCPCEEIAEQHIDQFREEDEHWFKGTRSSLQAPDHQEFRREAETRREERMELKKMLEALVEKKKLRWVEAEVQLEALKDKPWESKRGKIIAAAIAQFHTEQPALEHQQPLMIEYQPEKETADAAVD